MLTRIVVCASLLGAAITGLAATQAGAAPQTSVTNLSVSPASTAVGATTNWTIGFTASSTGALPYPASTATLTLPTGTTFGSFYQGTVTDTTTGDPVSDDCENTSGTTVTCTWNYGYSANAGDVFSVALDGVTNPTATGSSSTTVSTSADTKAVTKSVTLTAAQAVSHLSVTPASTGAGATTNWGFGFTTSTTGALPYPASTVTLTLPAGTTFGSFEQGTVTDTTTGNVVSENCANTSGTTVTCTWNTGSKANAGDVLSIVLEDVTNPTTTGATSAAVTTSADTNAASKSVTFTAAQAVSNLSVSPASTAVGATTNWTIGFTTSSTGALDYPGSTVTLTLPPGSTFGSFQQGTVTDTTTGNPVSDDCENTSGTTLTCNWNYGYSSNAGDVLSIVLNGVTNPTATGPAGTAVSTSADTSAATQSVTFTAAQAVSNLSVSPASTATGATTNWTFGFTTSSTGALGYPSDSVSVTLPAGTTFGFYDQGTVTDTTTGNTLSEECDNTSGTTVVCTYDTGTSSNAGDVLSVVLTDVTNPTTTGLASTTVTTSADTAAATTSFTVTPAQAVSNLSVTPTSTAAGSTTNWTIGFTTSSTGALDYPGSSVTLKLPPGTTFSSFGGAIVTDTTTGDTLSSDCGVTGVTVTCDWNYGTSSNGGDVLSVVLSDVTNPTTAGSASTTVSTSADTVAATKSVTITAAQGPVCAKVKGKISGTVTLSKCTPTNASYASAAGPASALTSGGGTFKWATSGKSTTVTDSMSNPGQGACKAGSIERDITGSVTGGSAKKYAKAGDAVLLRLCQSGTGALSLVTGTKATF